MSLKSIFCFYKQIGNSKTLGHVEFMLASCLYICFLRKLVFQIPISGLCLDFSQILGHIETTVSLSVLITAEKKNSLNYVRFQFLATILSFVLLETTFHIELFGFIRVAHHMKKVLVFRDLRFKVDIFFVFPIFYSSGRSHCTSGPPANISETVSIEVLSISGSCMQLKS